MTTVVATVIVKLGLALCVLRASGIKKV